MSTTAQPAVNEARLLRLFLEMVKIDSPSGQEDALREALIGWLKPYALDFRVDQGGNLIVEVPGHHCSHDRILVLSGHMDVVPPCHNIRPIVEEIDGDKLITSDNTTVLGADDKSGLAPILEAVFLAIENGLPRPKLRLLFTTREETCLGGAKELDDAALKADFALTLDHTGKQGVIINEAPTYIEFEIECFGKSVHAGIMPEQGINAITFAAKVIDALHLGRIDADTTANIGFWTGGKATNIVPDKSILRGELRGHNPAVLEREIQHIQDTLAHISAEIPGTRYEFRHQTSFEGYRLPQEHPDVHRVVVAAKKTGLEPQFIRTNGGSDNNIFMKRGLPGVVLSAGYMEPHSLKECVRLSEMVLCTRFLLNVMETFARD
jgi:tripeptide aminopeptidase